MLMYHFLMLHFKMNKSLCRQQNQANPFRGKFHLICNLIDQFYIINCSNLLILQMCDRTLNLSWLFHYKYYNFQWCTCVFYCCTNNFLLLIPSQWFRCQIFMLNSYVPFSKDPLFYVALIKNCFLFLLFVPPKEFRNHLVSLCNYLVTFHTLLIFNGFDWFK